MEIKDKTQGSDSSLLCEHIAMSLFQVESTDCYLLKFQILAKRDMTRHFTGDVTHAVTSC